MSHRFSYPSLMGPNLDAKPSELPNSDVALSEYDDGYNNAGLDVCNEFAEVANRELINRELVNLENAVVNIDNSNDVIIGPVTQFNVNGNVTIYQNKDGQPVEIEEKPDISTPAYTDIDFVYNTYNPYRVNEKLPPKIKESYKKAITWTCCSIIVIIVMCATLIFIKLLLLRTHKEIFGVSNRSVENKMFNSAPNVFCRHQWGGVPPKNPTPFTFPIELVVIKETGGRFCEIEEVCKELTLKIQTLHMTTMNYSDIGYNFLVGGDGNIYVGRGFGVQNVNMRRSIDIAIHEKTFKQRRKKCPTFQITCWKERKIKLESILKISFFLIILSSCLLVYLLGISSINKNQGPPPDTCYGHTLGNYSVYYRDDYHGVPPTNRIFQPLPLGLVVIKHTDTITCNSLKNCSKIVRSLQDSDMNSHGLYDLSENFLIAVDGSIYVARGWDVKNGYPIVSITISFIGNFNSDLVTADMVTSLTLLLRQGVELSKLAPDYIIVGENQTAVSVSPGSHVFEILQEFCHYRDIDLISKMAYDLLSAIFITVFKKTSFYSSQNQKSCIE